MKTFVVAALVLTLAGILVAGRPLESAKSTPGFDRMKSLVGTWKGKDGDGKPVTATYTLVSAGSAMMETLDMADEHGAMVTMYHLDGPKLMMTHYCSLGNQPRMRVEKASKDENTLTFTYVGSTNLSSNKENHMSKLVVTFKDADHFSQLWTMRMEGKMDHPATFDFERVK